MRNGSARGRRARAGSAYERGAGRPEPARRTSPAAARAAVRLGDLLRKLAAPFVVLGGLLLKFGGLLLKFKILLTAGSMLVSIAAYTWLWGLPVRDRLRAPDPRARARPRRRAQKAGRPGERAAVHPVPRRGHRDEGASRRRLEGGEGRARRPAARLRRRGRCWIAGEATGLGRARWASPSSASS